MTPAEQAARAMVEDWCNDPAKDLEWLIRQVATAIEQARAEVERLRGELGKAWDHCVTECGGQIKATQARVRELEAEVARLQENEYAVLHKGLDLMAWVKVAEAAQARVRELEAALGHLLGELSDIQIEAVREGCGNTNAACLRRRVDEARAALTEPTPPAEEQGK